MKIWFPSTTLKRINKIIPKDENVVDFILIAVEERLIKLEQELNGNGGGKKH
ncbi:MAG: hypothetical protein ACFFCV_02495 [Promethearchaeota archaeon]